jgi:hypothetical protein
MHESIVGFSDFIETYNNICGVSACIEEFSYALVGELSLFTRLFVT